MDTDYANRLQCFDGVYDILNFRQLLDVAASRRRQRRAIEVNQRAFRERA